VIGVDLTTMNIRTNCCRNVFPTLESPVGEVIRFVPKSELERARLIREARAIYESIFPSDHAVGSAEHDRRE
jgi:hypothetical protein